MRKLLAFATVPCRCGHYGAEHDPTRAGFGACAFATGTTTDVNGARVVSAVRCECPRFDPVQGAATERAARATALPE